MQGFALIENEKKIKKAVNFHGFLLIPDKKTTCYAGGMNGL
jgi:hypothetical protein